MKKLIALLLIIFSTPLLIPVKAQFRPINYVTPASVYFQNFDSLPSSGIFSLQGKGPHHFSTSPFSPPRQSGWFFLQYAGSSGQANFYISSGSAATHGMISTGITNQNDRSLGSLSTSGGSYAFGLILVNQTLVTLNTLDVKAQVKQWRRGGSGRKNLWLMRMKTGVWEGIDTSGSRSFPLGNFSSIHSGSGTTALNGNLTENQQALSFQIENITWKPGEQMMIWWIDPDEPGNDDVCSIDDFSFKAERWLKVPWIDKAIADSISPIDARLSCRVNPGGSITRTEWEYDTSARFEFPLTVSGTPNEISVASDSVAVKGHLTQLLPGKKYVARLVATNEAGSVFGEPISFTTPEVLPDIFILSHRITAKDEAEITLTIQNREKPYPENIGLQWSLFPDFRNSKNISAPKPGKDTFQLKVSELPAYTKIYVRGYLMQNTNLSTGKTYTFQTPIHINRFLLKSAAISADSLAYFELELSNQVPELNTSHFSIITKDVTDAVVSSLQKTGNLIHIAISTGKGDGTISLQFNSVNNDLPTIYGTPVIASGTVIIDKTAPVIKKISFSDKPYKVGDTVNLFTEIVPDTGQIDLVQASWAGLKISNWKRLNDSIFVSTLVIPPGNIEINPLSPVIIQIRLKDRLGNSTETIEYMVRQDNDLIDTKPPDIRKVSVSDPGIYAMGDTIRWQVHFSEHIQLSVQDRKPYLWVTIGSLNRQAGLRTIDSNLLIFEYVVKSGDLDTNGITWKNSITLNGNRLSDLAGNSAFLDWVSTPLSPLIAVDGVAPQIKQIICSPPFLYKKGDLLSFSLLLSEPFILQGTTDSVFLQIHMQSKTIQLQMKGRNDSMLHFGYHIQEGDWDKVGVIPLQLITGKNIRITDLAGNFLTTEIKQLNNGTGIIIDATAPQFYSPGDTSIVLCESDTLITLRGIADFFDWEPGEKIVLEKTFFSSTQSILIQSDTFLSNGSTIKSNINIKRKPKNETSKDSIRLALSDGIHFHTKWIQIEYLPDIQNNLIEPPGIRCSTIPPTPIYASSPSGGNGYYQYLWEKAPNPAGSYTRAGHHDTLTNYLPTGITDSIYLRRKVTSGACNNYSPFILLPIMGKGLWLGKQSSAWNLAENWCRQEVPLPDIDVVILGGTPFQPAIQSTAYCRSLTINDSASLILKGSIQVNGNLFVKSSAIDGSLGALMLSGEDTQIISGMTFKKNQLADLIIRNKKAVILKDSLFLNRQVLLQLGNLMIDGQLQLGKNAEIGPAAEGSVIMGLVGVTYPIPGKKRQYHFTAHPFSHGIGLRQLTKEIDITGDQKSDSGFALTPLQLPSAFKLSNVKLNSISQPLIWQAFTSLNGQVPNSWEKSEGIRWLFRGNKGKGLDDETDWLQENKNVFTGEMAIHLKGELNTGDQCISFPDSSEGFRLVGNPFVSKIDTKGLQLSDSIAPVYWKWNPQQGISGGFTCNSFASNDSLPPFETLLIYLRGSKNNHQIIFPEKSKISSAIPAFQTNEQNNIPTILLEWWKDSLFIDRVTIRDNKSAVSDFDYWDGIKINNPSHDLFTTTNSGQKLSYDQRPFHAQTKINVGTDNASNGNYQMHLFKKNWQEEYRWQLFDRYTGKWWPMNRDTIIPFTINQDTLSRSNTRFTIVGPWTTAFDSNSMLRPLLRIWPVPAKDILYIGSLWWPKTEVSVRFFSKEGKCIKNMRLSVSEKSVIEINVMDLLPGIYQVVINNREQNFYAAGRWIKQ